MRRTAVKVIYTEAIADIIEATSDQRHADELLVARLDHQARRPVTCG